MPETVGTLPADPAAERAVLGAVLVDPRQLDGVRQILVATDFRDPRHQRLFAAICDLDSQRQAVDPLTLRARLENQGQLATAGGDSYLLALFDGVAQSSNAAEYARLVHAHARSRDLHRLGRQVAEASLRDDPEAVLAQAEKGLFEIARGASARNPVSVGATIGEIADEADEERAGYAGLPTGLRRLDDLIGGLRKSELILLGARPGEGKTSLALNIALFAGLRGSRVLFFSLEMSERQLAIRLLYSHARVDAKLLTQPGRFSDQDVRRIRNARRALADIPVLVDESEVTPIDVRSKARQLHRGEDPLGLIVVDYLQLMRPAPTATRRYENRNLEIAEISRSLKLLAKELDVPVLALSQLSRAPEQREASAPRLSDLRESGALEQDADIVLFVHRSRRKPLDGEPVRHGPETRQLIVAKNRNGPTGNVTLAWLARFTRFQTPEEEDGEIDGGEEWASAAPT